VIYPDSQHGLVRKDVVPVVCNPYVLSHLLNKDARIIKPGTRSYQKIDDLGNRHVVNDRTVVEGGDLEDLLPDDLPFIQRCTHPSRILKCQIRVNGKLTVWCAQHDEKDYRPRPGWVADGFDVTEVDTVFTGKAIEFMENNCKKHPASPFFLYLPLSSPHAPWLPPDFVKGRSGDSARGDMVVWTDWCVGRIIDALDRLGLTENTLLIVTSDNGPRHGQKGHKSSGQLRGFKSHIWEGGHRIPFIARWPGKIKPGTTSDEVICLTDLVATCAAIVGAELPADAGPDSFNILPALLGAELDEPIRPAIVHHSVYGVFSIRQGKWKLILDTKTSGGWVRPSGKKPQPGTPGQLYNLRDDPYEQNDLWDKYPDVVERLTKLLEKYKRQGHSQY